MFKQVGAVLPSAGEPRSEPNEVGVKRVFMVLHGFYGNLFSSKFATGIVENNEDQGMASARRVWAHSLGEFDADTIRLALRRCRERHPEFPPSLPQLVALCDAAKPREVWKPVESGQPLLTESDESRLQRREARIRQAKETAERLREKREATGLDALKQALASAVGAAGGDEVAELLRLDRMLAPKVAA